MENIVNENNLVTDGNLTYWGDNFIMYRNIKSLYCAPEILSVVIQLNYNYTSIRKKLGDKQSLQKFLATSLRV